MGFLPLLCYFIGFFSPFLTLPPAFSDGLRIIFLYAFIEVMEARAKKKKKKPVKVAEGKVGDGEGEGVKVADMLIVRDKHFSAVVILGEAVTSLAC